ncbi:unnamed protein product [Moneuplotes crassus]|uniref:Serine aminopeptidase S33 domain-containing protein n=1 Tax=Euplotes crassus TaxID=5936 RepID=A0AAD1XES5_EUPCR|nr:unnamed protein product [Moneuplotes crassus]
MSAIGGCCKWLCFSITFILFLVLILATMFQNTIVYVNRGPFAAFPEDNPRGFQSPSEYHMPYEDVIIPTEDSCELKGWLMLHPHPKKKSTIVFFHENAGNIGLRLPVVKSMYDSLDSNILLVGYRGYGHSTCDPSEKGLKLDSRAILDYAFNSKTIDTENVFVFGASLGGATTIYSSKFYEDKIKGLILMNTFTSLPDVVDSMNIVFKIFRPFVLSNFWPSDERIKSLTLPMLFISGREDEIIPKEQMDLLFIHAEKSRYRDFIKVKDGHHNDTFFHGGDQLLEKILKFMKKCAEFKHKEHSQRSLMQVKVKL